MRLPSLAKEIVDPSSKKVGLGWQVFIWATYGAFFAKTQAGAPLMDASTWLLAVTAATALIGGGTILDKRHELEMKKLDGSTLGGSTNDKPIA